VFLLFVSTFLLCYMLLLFVNISLLCFVGVHQCILVVCSCCLLMFFCSFTPLCLV
jgi:hypothetical protein